MKINRTKLIKRQEGLVSIIVSIFIMLLITLIVLAMSQNSRRDQRQALDRQLSTQAFYAAESGINDTKKFLRINGANPVNEERKTCNSTSPALDTNFFKTTFNADSGTGYSCVLWDLTPTELIYNQIKQDLPEVVPITSKNGASLSTVTLTWQAESVPDKNNLDYYACPPSINTFPKNLDADNCDAGILRVELINADTANLNREALTNSNFIAFMVPQSSGSGSVTYGSANTIGGQGQTVSAKCTSGNKGCEVTISGLTPTKMYLVIRSIYKENVVSVRATDSNGDAVSFKDGQALIEVTGKASDVLKRIQVRLPITAAGSFTREAFTLHSGDSLCKLLEVYPDTPLDVGRSADAARCPITP